MKILKNLNSLAVAALVIGGVIFLLPATDCSAQDWKVPSGDASMVNPKAGAKDVNNVGKALWDQYCKSCHGKEGYGNGKKAGQLDTEMRDFTTKEVQSQKDGELYYKSFTGRDEMPNFEKKIPSKEDRWLLINYIRTMK